MLQTDQCHSINEYAVAAVQTMQPYAAIAAATCYYYYIF